MGWIFASLLVVLILFVILGFSRTGWKLRRRQLLSLFGLILIAGGMVATVPTGHTGILTTFGKVENVTLEAGVHVKSPFQKVVVMDNHITGMTGHQNNPANGLTISGDPTVAIDLEALAHAIGIRRVVTVDPFDVEATRAAIEAELQVEEPSLVISRRPCALLKTVKQACRFGAISKA